MWRLLIFELILVAVVVGVWLLAPLVGITSVLWRVVIILALLLPPVGMLIWKLISARKSAKGLEEEIREQGLAQQDSVRPDRQEEIQVLNDTFSQAIAALKRSRLGGSGSTALYALPWYMIIGPPAVGKSTALLRSGLKFPFTSSDQKGIKGVGGTRNCDWWFADRAILLDTAGRYASEKEDEPEWLAFLRMIKKYRRKRPLNGLMVAVSIDELVTARADERDRLATQLRGRVDQITKELELALPVYVLLTKCDLMAGFVEFFGDLKRSSRAQVLGFTVPPTTSGEQIEQVFRQEFGLLAGRLKQRALSRLGSARKRDRASIFQFPLQFAAAGEPVAQFIATLMMANPYMENPLLRGVYFCSGTQEGRPVDRVMAQMASAMGLRELGGDEFQEKSTKKSYFLHDVFTEVIFPDQHLAGTTVAGRKRRRRLGIAAIAAGGLASVLIVGLSAMTFGNNRSLITSSVELAKDSRVTTPEDPRQMLEVFQSLEKLGQRLDLLKQHEEDGPPWSHGLGFYRGEDLRQPLERVYIKRMRQAFVIPAGSELEATLQDVGSARDASEGEGAARDFNLLKTYLMVTEPKRLEVDEAARVLVDQWGKRLHPEVSQQRDLLLKHARRYLHLLKQGKDRWLEQDPNLVASVRDALRGRDAEYQNLIGDAEQRLRPFTLRDALRGRVQTVLEAGYQVPGVYTRTGWSRYMRTRIARQVASSSKVEPWVLGEKETKNATKRLRDRYFDQYIIAWRRFLKELSLQQAPDAAAAKRILEVITESPSIYQDLLAAVAHNTRLPMVDEATVNMASKLGSKLLKGKAGKVVRALGPGAGDIGPKTRVEQSFQPLNELVHPPEGADGRPQISGLQQYLGRLSAILDELTKELEGKNPPGADSLAKAVEEGRSVTKGLLATLPGELRRLVGPLLLAPIEGTSGTAKVAQADRTSRSFSEALCPVFAEKLQGRYPFARSQTEALFQDAVEFFSPGGTVWSYYDSSFKTLLPRSGDSYQAAPGQDVPGHIVAFFNQAWGITRAMFPLGSETPDLSFQVRPYPAVVAEGSDYQVSEISLEVEDKAPVYRNGPQEQWAFKWTGQEKRSRLLVRGARGLQEEIAFKGSWSLLRLVDAGKVRKRGTWYRVEWPLKGKKILVPMDFRPARSHNPLFTPLKLTCR